MVEQIIDRASPIHPLRTRRDLAAVADLVELCFADIMDADGREYLRQMRRIAQSWSGFDPAGDLIDQGRLPVRGLVWEENGRIVGNLTLISFWHKGNRIFLIANVAVHPDFRRRGIARQLTLAGLDYAHTHNAQTTWLHVRDDNLGAQELYHQIGFIERTRRATWQFEHQISNHMAKVVSDLQVRPPAGKDWPFISQWLDMNYPATVSWNIKIRKENMKPGFWQEFWRFLNNSRSLHLAAYRKGEVLGSVIWEPTNLYADTLWLASDPENEDEAIPILLDQIRRSLPISRPLAVNYPAGRAVEAFEMCYFSLQNTLIWMEYPFTTTRRSVQNEKADHSTHY